MKRLVFCFVLLLLATFPAFATVRNVPSQYSTIQAGINASVNGDTVLVASGVYTENISFNGRNISLIGQSGSDSTIIQKQVNGLNILYLLDVYFLDSALKGLQFKTRAE